MEYRILGKTGLKASVVGIGGEGFENKSFPECEEIIDAAFSNGINIIDIYNSNPDVRSNVGTALKKYPRESYIIEGHLCSVWDNGQYRRSRNIDEVKEAFEDFLSRMRIGYVDIGMIHYVDDKKDFENVFNGEIIKYAKSLKEKGIIKHIGLSTHNPDIAFMAVESGIIEIIQYKSGIRYASGKRRHRFYV